MNAQHLSYCAGPEWAETVRMHVIPWVTSGTDLGCHLLEVGPGPGLTTDILCTMTAKLTAVELDHDLAESLRERMAGTNVVVVEADATELPFEARPFSAAICLTMLHHVPTLEDQDRLFAEMARVVQPGGLILGSDSLDSPEFRTFHEGDICTPVDPDGLAARLERLGMRDVVVEKNPFSLKFSARAV